MDTNVGGPIWTEQLFFYGSYYRPTNTRNNRANLYGPLPSFDSDRNEGFGKLTFTPTHSILINGSYRDSKREDTSVSDFAFNQAGTSGSGNDARLKIATADGSWVINNQSYLTSKYTHFTNRTHGVPDNIANVSATTAIGTQLDINNLDTIGQLTVPILMTDQTYNAFVNPVISRYGYPVNGVQTGGGTVGYSTLFDNDDFFRQAGRSATT